jgi:hypothetical protein
MRKLTLNPDTLQVASFAAEPVVMGTRGAAAGVEVNARCPWSYCLCTDYCTFDQYC